MLLLSLQDTHSLEDRHLISQLQMAQFFSDHVIQQYRSFAAGVLNSQTNYMH